MDDSSVVNFIEQLKVDDRLRQKVTVAETALSATIKRDTASIAEIAAEAGFDISGWSSRPSAEQPEPTEGEMISFCCTLTCCVVTTSTQTPKPIAIA
jgi:hypothetical protein